jgi:TonB-linked SusC/RagA family outer membrane protein
VTALGIERERSQLGTAQQQLSTTELNQTRTQSVATQMQGKVSGVNITGAGTQGGSTNIIIRGQNSLTGNNQPLFIVDGIPVSNYNRGGNIIDGYDFGNAISDLNPDDIESLTVLKGPNAAAIYGSRAANGVIVITTKKGRSTGGRARVELSSNVTFEGPSLLPKFQNRYGQGAAGEFEFVDGEGGGNCDGCDQSWGPKLDGRLIDQFTGPQQPWVAQPNNVRDFFETGRTISNTIAVSGGTDRVNARLSLGHDNIDGYIPGNTFQKTSALLTGGLQVNSRLTTNATVQYIRNSGENRPGTGYSNSTLEQFFWFGRQVNINDLKNYKQGSEMNNGPEGREFNWNYNYHNNPYWLAYENPISDSRDRFVGNVSATYALADWAKATVRTGSDIFRFNVDQRWARNNLVNSNLNYAGAFEFIDDYGNENNTELLVTADRQLNERFRVQATAGGNLRRERFTSDSAASQGLLIEGTYNVRNAAITPNLGAEETRRQVNSVYGSALFTLNNFWTVEGTARNDWSSTLPRGENSYFYPSINTSVVLTDALPAIKSNVLSYAKIRGSIAQVGNDALPYQLATTFTGNSNKFAGQPQFSLGDNLANAQLKPEITRSDEVGLELGFFDGRANFDATYYAKETRDQIFNVTVSGASGYQTKAVNAGSLTNKGFEALVSLTPVQTRGGFTWVSSFNYSQNRSHVASLTEGVSSIILGQGIFAEVNIEARQGQPYGTIFGTSFARDSAGNLLTSGGIPYSGGFKVLGNIQPKWTGGWNNQFNFKNVSLGLLVDVRRGGKVVSQTNEVGEYSGVLESSLRGREIDYDEPGILVKGIDVDTGEPNDTRVTPRSTSRASSR